MKRRLILGIVTSLLLGGCGYISPRSMPMHGGNGDPLAGKYASNGEQIYFTAIDKNGQYISYTGGPRFGGMMMNSYLTCASCHGTDGRGGTHIMHMQVMDAPPIYYNVLVEMMQEEEHDASLMDEYPFDRFREAVVDGKHPDGDELDKDMPRWQMQDEDLADLLSFLKTLP